MICPLAFTLLPTQFKSTITTTRTTIPYYQTPTIQYKPLTMSANSSLKPITIYGKHGPNPPKVRMLCEELGLPYDLQDTQFPDLKKPAFLAINPNGRMPAIHDPNTDLTLWESGAILEYLVEKYDTEHKLSFPAGSHEAQHARQWLFFQVSGQGPYYGQAVWFTKYHPEQVESARERYYKEIERVTSVLDGHLQKQDKGADGPWLVGGKFSYADLAFVPWQVMTGLLADKIDVEKYAAVSDWLERLKKREAIGKVVAEFPGAR
jgi:glutathione S-transferase